MQSPEDEASVAGVCTMLPGLIHRRRGAVICDRLRKAAGALWARELMLRAVDSMEGRGDMTPSRYRRRYWLLSMCSGSVSNGSICAEGGFLVSTKLSSYAYDTVAPHTSSFPARRRCRWVIRRINGDRGRVRGSSRLRDAVGPGRLGLGNVACTVGKLFRGGLFVRAGLPIDGIGRVAALSL